MDNLKYAVDSLLERQGDYSLADAYYSGTVGEAFASSFFARKFKNQNFHVNFAATVIDAVNNRLEIDAIVGSNQKATERLGKIMEQNEMALETNEIHKKALIFGECYVIVWPDDEGDVEISYNSPLSTTIVYSNENQRKKEYAIKMWTEGTDANKRSRLNVYYPDRIEKYSAQGEVTDGNANWSLFDTVENPFGEVPVFHFRTSRPHGVPEHLRAYGPQDMITKLINTHMTAVDYQGAPQRYALTGAAAGDEGELFDEDDTDRDNLSLLRNGPGELWYLKGVDQVGQFDPADHKSFTEPMQVYVRAMASSTDTPMHYFERQGNVPSGEALRTAEAPLMKKVQDRQVSFGSTWRDVYRFALKIDGIKADAQVKWKASESMDTLDAWEVATRKKLVGVSSYQIFLEMGYDEEIAKDMAEKADANPNPGLGAGMNSHNQLLEQQADTASDDAN